MEPREGLAVCPRCERRDDAAAIRPLFIVTGASGSGKTAVLAPLARQLQGRCVTFDVDWLLDAAGELGGGQPVRWPALRDAWLAVAHGIAQSGMATVLLGPLIPEHLDGLPARRWIGDIHFVALDCPDQLRGERIRTRPSWRGRDVEEQTEFGRWLRSNITDRIDTSRGTPEDTAAEIAAWVDGHLTRSLTGHPPAPENDRDLKPPRLNVDERTTLHALLQYQRDSLVRKITGVDEDAARWSGVGSGTTLLWLIKHLTRAEILWIVSRFGGEDITLPDEGVRPDDTVASVLADYRAAWARVDAVATAGGLDEPCRRASDETPVNLRWVLAHLLEETARHAGHADILRELIDRTTGR